MKINHTKKGTPVLDVSGYEMVDISGAYRYVSHQDKLLTTGFTTTAGLIKNSDIILATDSAIATMQERYKEIFGHSQ